MLRKLLKYEFKSTGRTFLPIYGALLITAFLTRLFVFNKDVSNSFFLGIFQMVLSSLFGFLLMAVFILTLVVSLQRFYKNLLGEEGYLSIALAAHLLQIPDLSGVVYFKQFCRLPGLCDSGL